MYAITASEIVTGLAQTGEGREITSGALAVVRKWLKEHSKED